MPLRRAADPHADGLAVALVGKRDVAPGLVDGLAARGHHVTAWSPGDPLSAFAGADVAVATGWQAVPTVLRLEDVAARAYVVHDHEPGRYPRSAQRLWAEWSLRQGLHCICASAWLAELVAGTYAATTTTFEPGIEREHFRPLPTHRRDDLVLAFTPPRSPRRAVPLALLAMAELHRRRPDVEIALFGDDRPLDTPFPHRALGVLEPDALAHAYASATVGVALSLTSPSRVPVEMAACGLPVVELRRPGSDAAAPFELAEPDPLALCAAVERLLDDMVLRAERSRAGTTLAHERTWERAAEHVEVGLREALRRAAR